MLGIILGANLSLLKHLRDGLTQSFILKKSRKELDDFVKSVESECSFPKIRLGLEGIKEHTRS